MREMKRLQKPFVNYEKYKWFCHLMRMKPMSHAAKGVQRDIRNNKRQVDQDEDELKESQTA